MASPDTVTPSIAVAPPSPKAAPLPVLRVQASGDAIVQTLAEAARRGRMAGFEPGQPGSGVLFTTCAFSAPFDGLLDARATEVDGQTELRFSPRLKKKVLWIFVAVMVLSIWPGVVLTESLLASLLPSWDWLWGTTYWWYLPLSIIGAPWAIWSAVKKSRAEMAVSAVEMVGKVQKELGARQV